MKTESNTLEDFLGKIVGDLGAGITGSLVLIGDRLGLYKAMVELGPCTSEELATATKTHERYIREWLSNQAAAGYISYDTASRRFTLPEEHAMVLADEDSPFHLVGGFYNLGSVFRDEEMLARAFKAGAGVPWGDHHSCLFCGTAKFFRASYEGNLLQTWIPALDGVQTRLETGISVADVGCGYGESTLIMAKAFPQSRFVGIDIHAPSIEHANKRAEELGLRNVYFEVGTAKDYPGSYDLVTVFDALHDMGDPVGAATHVWRSLRPGGKWMVVEPFAHDNLEDNLNPVGQVFYGFSTAICVPTSVDQEVGLGLGAQAGPKRITSVIQEGGFDDIRVAVETPFNLVFEASKKGGNP